MNEERTDPAHLRALAEGATPGPWRTEPDPISGASYFIAGADDDAPSMAADHEPTARYIAAISPDVMLALLDRMERVEEALGRMLGTHDGVHAESCNCYEKGHDEDLDVDDTCDCGRQTRTRAHAALRGEP